MGSPPCRVRFPRAARTYCVDLSTDQADSVANQLMVPHPATFFTDTVACYVKNSYFPVGFAVPLGFYDASDPGRLEGRAGWRRVANSGAAGDTAAIVDTDGDGRGR